MATVLVRTFSPPHPVSLRHTLAPLCRGRGDPTMTINTDGVWRATRTPDGPATAHLSASGGDITVRAWGPGAEWAVDGAPALAGAEDDASGFEPDAPVLRDAARRYAGARVSRSRAVLEALVPTILEQKVVGQAARRSYADLVRRYSEPAPGPNPHRLRLPPDPRRLAATPGWAFHSLNVERKRADAIRAACAYAHRVDETATMPLADAYARLTALPGVGTWSAAQVALVALGDTDAVPVGDFHLKHIVAWNLAGRARGTDEEMLELLERYRPHRGRVVRLLKLAGDTPPRFGPRLDPAAIAAL